MHELHLIKDLVSDLLKCAKKRRITDVYIRLGKFTEINSEILKKIFTLETKGTLAEGAKIHIEESKARELRLLSFDCI